MIIITQIISIMIIIIIRLIIVVLGRRPRSNPRKGPGAVDRGSHRDRDK